MFLLISTAPSHEQPSSVCRIAAVHEERVTGYIAGSRAAEPQHGGGNLLQSGM